MFEPRFPLHSAPAPAESVLCALIAGQGSAAFSPWTVLGGQGDNSAETAPDDALDAYAEGFAAGHAAALAEQVDVASADTDALAAMADALGQMAAIHATATPQSLASALSRLLVTIVGEVDIPPATLQYRAANLLAAVEATGTPTALLCHPADAAIIGPVLAAIPVQPDPAMTRGSLRLATASGWIEDSIADRLAHIDAMLAARCAA